MELLTGVATVPAIVALVNLAKQLGLPVRLALVLAVVLGVGLSLADGLLAGVAWYGYASSGLLLGLAAAGLYDLIPAGGTTARRAAD